MELMEEEINSLRFITHRSGYKGNIIAVLD